MARITVEDCIEKINNRFELILTAAQRSRGISRGEKPTIDRDNDKNTVLSLREIAEDTLDKAELEEEIIKRMQKTRSFEDRSEEELVEAIEKSTVEAEPTNEENANNAFLPASKKDSFSSNMDAQPNTPKFEDVDPDEIED